MKHHTAMIFCVQSGNLVGPPEEAHTDTQVSTYETYLSNLYIQVHKESGNSE